MHIETKTRVNAEDYLNIEVFPDGVRYINMSVTKNSEVRTDTNTNKEYTEYTTLEISTELPPSFTKSEDEILADIDNSVNELIAIDDELYRQMQVITNKKDYLSKEVKAMSNVVNSLLISGVTCKVPESVQLLPEEDLSTNNSDIIYTGQSQDNVNHIIDGDDTTTFATGSVEKDSSNIGKTDSFIIDLRQKKIVRRVKLQWEGTEYANTHELYISTDGETYEKFFFGMHESSLDEDKVCDIEIPYPLYGRYIKCLIMTCNALSLTDSCVFKNAVVFGQEC